jgi:hypothetical protein
MMKSFSTSTEHSPARHDQAGNDRAQPAQHADDRRTKSSGVQAAPHAFIPRPPGGQVEHDRGQQEDDGKMRAAAVNVLPECRAHTA